MVSICLFGSQARKTADVHSDKDVLIVSRSECDIEKISKKWSRLGWNVSLFPEDSFLRMVIKQSLFIQHLKQEGEIVRDDEDFLVSTLSGFGPKSDYNSERSCALDQLNSLPSPSGEYWADLCLADITYVLFRNFAVLHMASKAVYVFDYLQLVDLVAKEFALTMDQYESLRLLRTMKSGYRRRDLDLLVQPRLTTALAAVRSISDQLHMLVQKGRKSSPVTTDGYFLLRNMELQLVKQYDPRWLDALRAEEAGLEMWKLICSPGGYPKPGGFLDGNEDQTTKLINLTTGFSSLKKHVSALWREKQFLSTELSGLDLVLS